MVLLMLLLLLLLLLLGWDRASMDCRVKGVFLHPRGKDCLEASQKRRIARVQRLGEQTLLEFFGGRREEPFHSRELREEVARAASPAVDGQPGLVAEE